MSTGAVGNTTQSGTNDKVSQEFDRIRQLQQEDTIRDMRIKYVEERDNNHKRTLATLQDNSAKIASEIIQGMRLD